MVPLQKLLGKEDKFFDLLVGSAEQAYASARALSRFIHSPNEARNLNEFGEMRRKDKAITAEINEALCTEVVTALEPADIEALSHSLYKIPKTVEKVAERLLLAPEHLSGVDLRAQATMLEKATEILLQMVKEMKKGMSRARVQGLNEKLQSVEGDADKTVLELLRGLYLTEQHAGRALFLKDIFELMERCTDRCRDAGNVVAQITMKSV